MLSELAFKRHYADEDELDAAIDAWHEDLTVDIPLHEWLGWSWDEYTRWVEHSEVPRGNLEQDQQSAS